MSATASLNVNAKLEEDVGIPVVGNRLVGLQRYIQWTNNKHDWIDAPYMTAQNKSKSRTLFRVVDHDFCNAHPLPTTECKCGSEYCDHCWQVTRKSGCGLCEEKAELRKDSNKALAAAGLCRGDQELVSDDDTDDEPCEECGGCIFDGCNVNYFCADGPCRQCSVCKEGNFCEDHSTQCEKCDELVCYQCHGKCLCSMKKTADAAAT